MQEKNEKAPLETWDRECSRPTGGKEVRNKRYSFLMRCKDAFSTRNSAARAAFDSVTEC